MNLWQNFEIKREPPFKNCGFSLHFEPGIDAEMRRQYCAFARWLRKTYMFPVHINVYLLHTEKICLLDGRMSYGGFRYFTTKPPRIRVASAIERHLLGEYTEKELREQILSSFVHELSHYFQWILALEQSDAVSERQANYYRYRILERYYDDTIGKKCK